MSLPERLLALLAALAGLLGVALSAAAAHAAGGDRLRIAAQFLLFHAPALLALIALIASAAVNTKLARLAGFVMALGLLLFCGDLVLLAVAGVSPFPMAAPTGGILLMIGWLLAGAAALLNRRS